MRRRKDKDQRVLVCSLASAPNFVPDTAGRLDHCGRCDRPIWVSLSSPASDLRWCTECMVAQMKTGEPFKTLPLVESQIADIERWRAAQGRRQ